VSASGARAILDSALDLAEEFEVDVVVWLVDQGGNDVAMMRMDGAPLLSCQVAADKAWTAVAFGQPTTWWADTLTAEPALAALGRGNRLMPVPGGIPLFYSRVLIGGVGVSGASSEQDAAIASAAASIVTSAVAATVHP
jgi:uncharacterized protein GlcG (DUF336 family)